MNPKPKRVKVEVQPSKKREISSPGPLYRPAPANWPDALEKTIETVRLNAKISDEPETITNSKIEALRSHDPKNGAIVIWKRKENEIILVQTFIIKF